MHICTRLHDVMVVRSLALFLALITISAFCTQTTRNEIRSGKQGTEAELEKPIRHTVSLLQAFQTSIHVQSPVFSNLEVSTISTDWMNLACFAYILQMFSCVFRMWMLCKAISCGRARLRDRADYNGIQSQPRRNSAKQDEGEQQNLRPGFKSVVQYNRNMARDCHTYV